MDNSFDRLTLIEKVAIFSDITEFSIDTFNQITDRLSIISNLSFQENEGLVGFERRPIFKINERILSQLQPDITANSIAFINLYPNILVNLNLPFNYDQFSSILKSLLKFREYIKENYKNSPFHDKLKLNLKKYINLIYGYINSPNSCLRSIPYVQQLVVDVSRSVIFGIINELQDSFLCANCDEIYFQNYDSVKLTNFINSQCKLPFEIKEIDATICKEYVTRYFGCHNPICEKGEM